MIDMLEPLGAPFIGGTLIGLSASLLLLLKGRVFGISGILAGVLVPKQGDTAWRVAILLGLIAAGGIAQAISTGYLPGMTDHKPMRYVIAGLLVGFGTQLGSGCTSGHGVCGISRMSPRSMVATTCFIVAGMVMVAIIRAVGGNV